MPTEALLKEIAAHYQQKYAIDIEICTAEELPLLLQKLVALGRDSSSGIVVTSSTHVTPILCHFSANPPRKEVVVLDVLGSDSTYPFSEVIKALSEDNMSAI